MMNKPIVAALIVSLLTTSLQVFSSDTDGDQLDRQMKGFSLDSDTFYRHLRDPELYYWIFSPGEDFIARSNKFVQDLNFSENTAEKLIIDDEAFIRNAEAPISNLLPAAFAVRMSTAFDICDNNPQFNNKEKLLTRCWRSMELLIDKSAKEKSTQDRLRLICALEYCAETIAIHEGPLSVEKIVKKFSGLGKIGLSNDEIYVLGHLYIVLSKISNE